MNAEPSPGWAGVPWLAARPLVVFVLLAGLATLSYGNTFFAPFHFDDNSMLADNSQIKALANFRDGSGVRYVGFLSFALNYRLGGLNVVGYHVVNLLIHLTNGWLVYRLVGQLCRTPALRTGPAPLTAPQAGGVALVTALLFVVHPIQTQAVTYIVQRFASLAALFYLFAVVGYLQWRLAGPTSRSRFAWYAGALGATILAMKTKENTFTLPLMLVVVEGVFFQPRTWKAWVPLVPFLLTLPIIPFSLPEGVGEAEAGFARETTDISRWSYLVTQSRVLVTYLRLLVWPTHQNLDYDYPVYASVFELPVLGSALGLLGLLGLAIVLLRSSSRERLVGFGLGWWFLSLAVESSIIPIRDVIFEHRLYLPSVGMFLAVSVVGTRLGTRAGWGALVAAGAVIGVLAVATYERNQVWQDDLTLWRDVVAKSPRKARPHNNLGLAYFNQGRSDTAIMEFETALDLDPDYTETYGNLGNVYVEQGQMEAAIRKYQTALRLRPNFPKIHYALGHVYLIQGRIDAAIVELRIALQLDPNYAEAYSNLGIAYDQQGRLEAAVEAYRTAIRLKPESAEAHDNLGQAYAQRGQLEAAIREHQTAIALKADLPEAHYNLANAYAQQGQRETAILAYQTALRLRPDFAEAHNNLGNVYLAQGRREEAIGALSAAVRLQPASPEFHYNLGNAYAQHGRLDEAIAKFATSARLKPDFPEAYAKLGTVYAQQGRWDEAMVQFQRALQLRADFVEVHFSLGRVYALKGQRSAARQEFEIVLRHRPDFAPAQHALKLLDVPS